MHCAPPPLPEFELKVSFREALIYFTTGCRLVLLSFLTVFIVWSSNFVHFYKMKSNIKFPDFEWFLECGPFEVTNVFTMCYKCIETCVYVLLNITKKVFVSVRFFFGDEFFFAKSDILENHWFYTQKSSFFETMIFTEVGRWGICVVYASFRCETSLTKNKKLHATNFGESIFFES